MLPQTWYHLYRIDCAFNGCDLPISIPYRQVPSQSTEIEREMKTPKPINLAQGVQGGDKVPQGYTVGADGMVIAALAETTALTPSSRTLARSWQQITAWCGTVKEHHTPSPEIRCIGYLNAEAVVRFRGMGTLPLPSCMNKRQESALSKSILASIAEEGQGLVLGSR